jgi:hypothetical protein
MADYHPELAHLSWLIGNWSGFGVVGYPSMPSDIQVHQELSITHDGRPFLTHFSRTWELGADGERVRPLATEAGFWRPRPDNKVEFLLAHPTGFLELWLGKVEVTGIVDAVITGARVQLDTDAIVRTESAKDLSAGQRLYGLVNGDLAWVYDMKAMGHEMQSHSSFQLKRVG